MSAARIEVLTALRDRLGNAAGSDWELSVDIELALVPGTKRFIFTDFCVEKDGRRYNPPAYTASIDAAVTLLPPWDWLAYWDMNVEPGLPGTRVTLTPDSDGESITAVGATPALALCLVRIEYELAAIAERDS